MRSDKLFLAIALTATMAIAHGANIIWSGAAEDGDWFNAANWVAGTDAIVPSEGEFNPDGYRVLFETHNYADGDKGKVIFSKSVTHTGTGTGYNIFDFRNTLARPVIFSATDDAYGLTITQGRMAIGSASTKPGMDGFETLAKLRRFYPEIRVLLLAGMPLKVEEEKARAEGARGYLPKSLDWERLVSAIRIAAKDGDFIADDFDEPKVGPLSRREIDVLTYIAQGKTHEEIGIIGGISAETVRTHMKSILRKLDCANAPAAVSRAYELGILRA